MNKRKVGPIARSPINVRDSCSRDALLYSGESLTRGHKGALTGYLNKYVGGDENRHLVLSFLFSEDLKKLKPISSTELTEGQWYALDRWVNAYKDEETGKWEADQVFVVEAALVLTEAIRTYNKLKLRDKRVLDERPPGMIVAAVGDLDGIITSMIERDQMLTSNYVRIPCVMCKKEEKKEDLDDIEVEY